MTKLNPPKLMSRAKKYINFARAKSVTWENKIQNEGNMARNDYHFDDDESLKEAKQDIKDKIKRCRTNKTILNLLDNAFSTNKKVLDADYEFLMHYLKYHLNTENLTIDLLESNQTVKNLHDLVERHGDFGNFLAKQIKHYNIIQAEHTEPKTIEHTGKPWESNYLIVCSLCEDFEKHAIVLNTKGYIIDDDKETLTWDFNKASKKDFAHYFKKIKKGGRGEKFWVHIVDLFGLSIKDTYKAAEEAERLQQLAKDKKYTSDKLDILFSLLGLK